VPISVTQAALGDEIGVPTLDCSKKETCFDRLAVPPGTQHGAVFRLAEKGMPNLHGRRRGDQYVAIKVVVPTKLNEKQKELLEEFGRISGEEVRTPHKTFFNRFKDLLKIV